MNEKCVVPELNIESFKPKSPTFYLGDYANLTLVVKANDNFNYSFDVYWRHKSEESPASIYSNSSNYYEYDTWNLWYRPVKTGEWEAKIILKYDNKQIEKTTEFNVEEKRNENVAVIFV